MASGCILTGSCGTFPVLAAGFAERSCPLPPVALIAEEGSIGYPLDH